MSPSQLGGAAYHAVRPIFPGGGEQGRAQGGKGLGVEVSGSEESSGSRKTRFRPTPVFLQIKNMWAAFPPDVGGNVDYKNICYVITHGDAKDQE